MEQADHFRHRLQPRRSQNHRTRRARSNLASLIRFSAPIADANIDVDMIIQNIGHEGLTDFSFTVNRNEYRKDHGIAAKHRQAESRARAT